MIETWGGLNQNSCFYDPSIKGSRKLGSILLRNISRVMNLLWTVSIRIRTARRETICFGVNAWLLGLILITKRSSLLRDSVFQVGTKRSFTLGWILITSCLSQSGLLKERIYRLIRDETAITTGNSFVRRQSSVDLRNKKRMFCLKYPNSGQITYNPLIRQLKSVILLLSSIKGTFVVGYCHIAST